MVPAKPKPASAGPSARISSDCVPVVPAPPVTKPTVKSWPVAKFERTERLPSRPGLAVLTKASTAALLVTEPDELVTATVYAPALAAVAALITKRAPVAPAMALPFKYH